MKALIITTVLMVLRAEMPAAAQTKVANYSYGKSGTDTYEHLSFWVKDGKRAAIYYAYGKDRKEAKLNYWGKIPAGSNSGFTIQFSNSHTLTIIPVGIALKVIDAVDKAPKKFAWEYEGPVNGIGTFCEQCAEDEKEAMQLIKAHYLK